MFGGGIPVTKIGRIAGQFAKPRSADLETIDGVSLPSYRGDIINGPEFTEEARIPDPFRLVRAYHQSAATLNLLRGFSSGGYGGLDRVGSWNLDFMANSERGADYLALAARVEEALQFLQAVGINTGSQFMKETEFYTAHECLLLDYEVRVGVGCENGALGGSRVLLSYSQITASSRAHAVARASGAAVFFSAAGCH